MIRATPDDKELVVEILSASFAENNSANYIIKQDKQKAGRLQRLMAYSFDLSFAYGDVFLRRPHRMPTCETLATAFIAWRKYPPVF